MNLKITPSEATKTPLYSITCTNAYGDFMAPVICDNKELALTAFYTIVEEIISKISNIAGERDFINDYGKDINEKFYSEWLPEQEHVTVETTKIRFDLNADFFEINLYGPSETKTAHSLQ